MPKYNVTLPVAGVAYFTDIEAADEDEAIRKALELPLNIGLDNVSDLNTYKSLTEGNVIVIDSQDEASAEEQA